ncbi:reticulocyte-binding protein homolog 2a-like isoform X2 [Daktulosphaira vitifoliae]|nr:reticulocyte-binding protein homolog 2a-like isoform X2 [Daktulosphaira vitifoliae]
MATYLQKYGALTTNDVKKFNYVIKNNIADQKLPSKEIKEINNNQKETKHNLAVKKNLFKSLEFTNEIKSIGTYIQKHGQLNETKLKKWGHLFKKDLLKSPNFLKKNNKLKIRDFKTRVNNFRNNANISPIIANEKITRINYLRKRNEHSKIKLKKQRDIYKNVLKHPKIIQKKNLSQSLTRKQDELDKEVVKKRINTFNKYFISPPDLTKNLQSTTSLVKHLFEHKELRQWADIFKKDLMGSPKFTDEVQSLMNYILKKKKIETSDIKKWEHLFAEDFMKSSDFTKKIQLMATHIKKKHNYNTTEKKKNNNLNEISEKNKRGGNQPLVNEKENAEKILRLAISKPTNENKSLKNVNNHLLVNNQLTQKENNSSALKQDKSTGVIKKGEYDVDLIEENFKQEVQDNKMISNKIEYENDPLLNNKKRTFLKIEKRKNKKEEAFKRKIAEAAAYEELVKKKAQELEHKAELKRLKEQELEIQRKENEKEEEKKMTLHRKELLKKRAEALEAAEKTHKLEALQIKINKKFQEKEEWKQKINDEFLKNMKYTAQPNCILSIIPNLINNESEYKMSKRGKNRLIQIIKQKLKEIEEYNQIFDHGGLMKQIIKRELENTKTKQVKFSRRKNITSNEHFLF